MNLSRISFATFSVDLQRLVGASLLAGLLACNSGGGDDGIGNKSQNTTGGTLLIGAGTDSALQATTTLRSKPAKSNDVTDQGLIRTRLEAVMDPTATVQEINRALESVNALIVDMNEHHLFVSLSIPRQKTAKAANATAKQLTASGAFVEAFPAYTLQGNVAILPDEDVLDQDINPSHLRPISMPAAWNLASVIPDNAEKIDVLIPDKYYSDQGHPQLSALGFLSNDPSDFDLTQNENGTYKGNHGYHVAGVLGADFDDIAPTGVHPSPQQSLDLMALPIGNRNMTEVLSVIGDQFPEDITKKFVLNTSFGYSNSSFDDDNGGYSRYRRALDTFNWRLRSVERRDQMFYAAAAGNKGALPGDLGSAKYESPFTASLLFADIREMVQEETLDNEQLLLLDFLSDGLISLHPEAANADRNGLVVGFSNLIEDPHDDCSRDWQVLCEGQEIPGPCIAGEFDEFDQGIPCDTEIATYTGSSFAAPQVAGLAAYLWNLDPNLSPQEIQTILLGSMDELDSRNNGQRLCRRAFLGSRNLQRSNASRSAGCRAKRGR